MSALIKSTISVGSMTLLSRALGLLRDIIIAPSKYPIFCAAFLPKARFHWPSCRY